MIRSRLMFASLLVAAWPVSAAAGTWSLGSNFGISVLNTQSGGSSSVVTWPGDVFGYLPGIRIGFLDRRSSTEFFVDTGLYRSSGAEFRVLQTSGNIQFNLSRRASSGAYLDAGVGFWSSRQGTGSNSTSATVPSFGAGLGARRVLSQGHGAFRGEVRLDHFFENQAAGLEALTAMGFKFGFDLWMR